jgi:hypothetical protein
MRIPLFLSSLLLAVSIALPAAGARGFQSVKQIRANVDNRILMLCYGDTSSLGMETDKNAFTVKCVNQLIVQGGKKGEFVRAEFLLPMEPNTQAANAALDPIFEVVHAIVRDESDRVYSMEALGKMVQEPVAKTITGNLTLNRQYYTLGELKIESVYCMDGTGRFKGKSLTLILTPAKGKAGK